MKVEQAALLNCLMYYDDIMFNKNKSLGKNLIEKQKNTEEWNKIIKKCPGVMGPEKSQKVIDAIINDPDLSNLKIAECTRQRPRDNNPIMACFIDEKNKEVAFVYRGTNGREWMDNASGFLRESSLLQRDAEKFLENTIKEHKLIENNYNIIATGHSKGGNKAMYVTVKNPNVNECLSFDGQGFSNEFLEQNKTLIKKRENKITNYAANREIGRAHV